MAKQLEEILREIDAGMTDDKEHNVKYLSECSEKYRNEPNQLEIQRHIGRQVARNLPEDQERKFMEAHAADMKKLNSIFEEAKLLVSKKEFAAANQLLVDHEFDEGFGENYIVDDAVTTYLQFDNMVEEAYYSTKFKPEKVVRDIGLPFKLAFALAAFLAVENKDYPKAMRVLDKGIKRCPFDANLIFERMDIFKRTRQLEELKAFLIETSGFWYRRIDIAHYFRVFGYYYSEVRQWDAAIACYAVSGVYEDHPLVERELTYIHQQGKISIEEIQEYLSDYMRCKGVLEKLDMQILPTDPKLIRMFVDFAEQYENAGYHGNAAECYAILYDLLKNEDFKSKFENCLEEYNKKKQGAPDFTNHA